MGMKSLILEESDIRVELSRIKSSVRKMPKLPCSPTPHGHSFLVVKLVGQAEAYRKAIFPRGFGISSSAALLHQDSLLQPPTWGPPDGLTGLYQ